MEFPGQSEMDVGEVNENSYAGPALADGLLESTEFAVDARQMADNLGNAHNRHVFRTDDAFQTGIRHALAAHAEEACRFSGLCQPLSERLHQQGAV